MDPIVAITKEQAMLKAMEMRTMWIVSVALDATIHLHVLDILAQHGGVNIEGKECYLSAAQIVSHFEGSTAATTASTLDRILRLLASHGFLSSALTPTSTPDKEPTKTYALNAVSRLFLQSTDEGSGSLAPTVLLFQELFHMQSFRGLHESVIDGSVPFTRVHGMDFYPYIQKNASFGQFFNSTMAQSSKLMTQAFLHTYDGFAHINSLVEVGGGVGAFLSMITSKYPHIRAINFDLPHTIEAAHIYPGVEHVAGNMFIKIPKADAILLKRVLVDWNDEGCFKILENCYKALPTKGKVIVLDAILPTNVEDGVCAHANYQMDLLGYALFGAKLNTKERIECISRDVGFSRVQLICNLYEYTILEIIKEDN